MIDTPAVPVRSLAIALLATLLAGCSNSAAMWQLGLGSFTAELWVVRAVPRHDLIEATVAGHGLSLTAYAPASDACAYVFEPDAGAVVQYVERGVAGRYEREDAVCDAVGIGDPQMRGARKPRADQSRVTPIPRSQATFQELYRDEEVILLRGRFPEAVRVGWLGWADTIAVVPTEPRCEQAIQGGVASMEYRPSRRKRLTLVAPDGLCQIVGLVMPQAARPSGG